MNRKIGPHLWEFFKRNNSTNIHSNSFWSQSEPIWTNLKSEVFTIFPDYSLKWIWSQSEIWKSNLKSEESIWTNLNQSEPIWNLCLWFSRQRVWNQSEMNLKPIWNLKRISRQRPVSPPSSRWLISLLPSAPPPPRRPVARPQLDSPSRP